MRRRVRWHALFLAGVSLLCSLPVARALHPHQLGLIINQDHPGSVEVGLTYARTRGIPRSNIAFVHVPESALAPETSLTPAAFEQHIWKPAWKQFAAQGTQNGLLAWVYSSGFPSTISSDPKTSIHGYTFARTKLPPANSIRKGSAITPYFAGPTQPNGPKRNPLAFDRFPSVIQKEDPKASIPLPAMSLGYDGPRGIPTDHILTHLARQHTVQGNTFTGPFIFINRSGIRSQTRVWQFAEAIDELKALGHTSLEVEEAPSYSTPVAGVMDGRASMRVRYSKATPGGLAEHLTSFGATFGKDSGQTKITEWIRAGFGASTGTITEPYAIWTKFPHARTHAHLARGCTMIEALYQGVAAPWETYFWGDPLVRPGTPNPTFSIKPVSNASASGYHVIPAPKSPPLLVQPILDGRPVGPWSTDPLILWPTAQIPLGTREMRIAVCTANAIGAGAYTNLVLQGTDPGPSLSAPKSVRTHFPIALTIDDPTGSQWEIEGDALPRPKATDKNGQVTLLPADGIIPPGPLHLRAVRLEGQERIPGPSVIVQITSRNLPPVAQKILPTPSEDPQFRVLSIQTSDPEEDAVHLSVFTSLAPFMPPENKTASSWATAITDKIWSLRAVKENKGQNICRTLDYPESWGHWQEVHYQIRWEATVDLPTTHSTFLLFNMVDENTYDFAGFNGTRSAWTIGSRKDGKDRFHSERGYPQLLRGKYTDVRVLHGNDGGIELWVNHRLIGRWPEGRISNRSLGWRTSTGSARLLDPKMRTVLMSTKRPDTVKLPAAIPAPYIIRLDGGTRPVWTQWEPTETNQ